MNNTIVIFEYNSLESAQLCISKLKSEGILCFIPFEYSHSNRLMGLLPRAISRDGNPTVQIVIHKNDVEIAKKLILTSDSAKQNITYIFGENEEQEEQYPIHIDHIPRFIPKWLFLLFTLFRLLMIDIQYKMLKS